MNMHDHLPTLEESKTEWTLKVRVTRMWDTISNAGVVIAHNMIILDCLNTHMHAIVMPEIWNNQPVPIFEGGLYEVVNVKVHQAFGSFRPVSTDKCIRFTTSTTITPYVHDDFVIPMHKFEFKPLEDLCDIVLSSNPYQKPAYSIDVVGVMEELQPLQTVQTRFGQREVVRFRISDGSVSHMVHFWGPLDANTEPLYANHVERPVIVILASIKISAYEGKVQISNLPSSKIFINLDYEDVFMMRIRLAEQGYLANFNGH